MDLTRHFRSPSSFAPMAAPSPTALIMVILQVTDQSRLLIYLFWISNIFDFETTGYFCRCQGFKIKAFPATHDSWKMRYRSSRSLDPLLLEGTSSMLTTIIPKLWPRHNIGVPPWSDRINWQHSTDTILLVVTTMAHIAPIASHCPTYNTLGGINTPWHTGLDLVVSQPRKVPAPI